MVRIILTGILVGLLTACSGVAGPDQQVVKQAIALYLNQLQQELVQELRLDRQLQKFEISGIKVTEQQSLRIQALPTFRIQGTYDLALKFPERTVVEYQNPFKVYLQRQQAGTWSWLRPTTDPEQKTNWLSQPLRNPK